ncbi:MAG: biopolymer transporter ExbD [Deltaproteobacteria bacterium]|jgi:biopolymer transport protein ExbD
MKKPRSSRPRSVVFKMTAMIDMAFLLITFFIMSIRFGHQGEELVELPNADQAREVTDERIELITVNVTRDGYYVVSGIQRSGGKLFSYLKDRKEAAKEKIEVVIRGDREAEFNTIQRVMRLSAEAGIRAVSLAALQSGDFGNSQ